MFDRCPIDFRGAEEGWRNIGRALEEHWGSIGGGLEDWRRIGRGLEKAWRRIGGCIHRLSIDFRSNFDRCSIDVQ